MMRAAWWRTKRGGAEGELSVSASIKVEAAMVAVGLFARAVDRTNTRAHVI